MGNEERDYDFFCQDCGIGAYNEELEAMVDEECMVACPECGGHNFGEKDPDDPYIITQRGTWTFDVYNEDNGRRYETVTGNRAQRSCSCPHWIFRLKKSRGKCKHIEMCETRGGWNS